MNKLTVDISGEKLSCIPESEYTLGRMGDLIIDEENPYLHRNFLHLSHSGDFWWLANVGNRTVAHLGDSRGLNRSTLTPGHRMPLVFPETIVTFAAGAYTYEIHLVVEAPAFEPIAEPILPAGSDTTMGSTVFTETQLLSILALAEPLLRRVGTGSWEVPTSVQAAKRLGWSGTRFNRKLDNVCDKLDRIGLRGLKGTGGKPALSRRAVLVEYAVLTRIVTPDHLVILDAEAARNADGNRT